jgi:hypothetical protein
MIKYKVLVIVAVLLTSCKNSDNVIYLLDGCGSVDLDKKYIKMDTMNVIDYESYIESTWLTKYYPGVEKCKVICIDTIYPIDSTFTTLIAHFCIDDSANKAFLVKTLEQIK